MSRVRPPLDGDDAVKRAATYMRQAKQALDRLQACLDDDVADLGEATHKRFLRARDAADEMMRFFGPGSGSFRESAWKELEAGRDAMREVDLGVLRERLRDKRMAALEAESRRLREVERSRFDGDSFGKELAIMRGRR